MALTNCLLANIGTPLMWAGMFHLLFGNALIGIFEGLLLARLFRVQHAHAILSMCLANYASMAIGVLGLGLKHVGFSSTLDWDVTILNAKGVLLIALVICILLSAAFEWPFCYFALRGRSHRVRDSVAGSLVVQLASYAILVPLYLVVSPVNVLTSLSVVSPSTIATSTSADVYFIGRDDGDLHRVSLDGTDAARVAQAGLHDRFAQLFLARSRSADTYDLGIRWGPEPCEERIVAGDILPANARIGDAAGDRNTPRDGWLAFGRAVNLQDADQPQWEVNAGAWAAEGLHATQAATHRDVHVALETPFLAWYSRCPSVLPNDLVVYQLDDQIVLLDLNTRRIALLARGRSPLVVLRTPAPEGPTGTPSPTQ